MSKPARSHDRDAKDLATDIHLALYTLTKVYKPSPEFIKCFVHGMFIKSNPKAFPHVMHFLFYHLNPTEFTSKFAWPLHSDKTLEKEFRQSCVKHISHLNKKHNMGLDEVAINYNYIVVVPGGVKFMSVLLEFIKLVQVETLKVHGKESYLETPNIFDDQFRANAIRNHQTIERVSTELKSNLKKETLRFKKKCDMLLFNIRDLEGQLTDPSGSTDRPTTTASSVEDICRKMNRLVTVVAELEESFGISSSCDRQQIHNNPMERIKLSNAITQIAEHHNWFLNSDEFCNKIDCVKVLDVAARILTELRANPIKAAPLVPTDIINQEHEMGLFMGNLTSLTKELKLIRRDVEAAKEQQEIQALNNPKEPLTFPNRDYALPNLEESEPDFASIYFAYRQNPRHPMGILRYPLEDAILDISNTNTSLETPSTSLLFNRSNESQWSSVIGTSKKNMTAKKTSKAMSVLKTISRPNRRAKINMDVLKGLAKTGFGESMFDNSTVSWKKTNSMSKPSDNSQELADKAPLSSIFSESMLAKFNANQSSIFNSTTNEQAKNMAQLTDITNSLGIMTIGPKTDVVQSTIPIEKTHKQLFMELMEGTKEQENIFNSSDTILYLD